MTFSGLTALCAASVAELLWLWICLGVVGGAALLALFVWFNNSCIKTTRLEFESEKLEKGVKIVHLSDLHGKSFGKNNVRLVKKVSAEKPDLIVFTGDIVHRYTDKNKRVALELVSSLCGVAPLVFSAGNHEMRNVGYRFFRKDLKEAGAVVLDDCSADMCGLTLVGLNCASQKNGTVLRLSKEVAEKDALKILLAHKPHLFDKYVGLGFDFVLSGHAHGGQWRIPFTHIGLFAPGQGVLPEFSEGVHERGDTKMIISRGLGNSEFPLRLFNRPEIIVIDFKTKP